LQGRLTPPAAGAMTDFSSLSLTPPSETSRPPWEPRTRFEIEREATAVRGTLKTLSDAVGAALDVLMHTETDPKHQAEDRSRRKEALECLDYVREVLGQASKGDVGSLDEERLWGEKGLEKRKKVQAESPPQTSADLASQSKPAEPSPSAIVQPVKVANTPAVYRKTRGTSLPVNRPVERSLPTRQSETIVAPWNHTPSSFSNSSLSYSLPTKPPPTTLAPPPAARTSSRPEPIREHTGASVHQDPLGVLR